MECSKCGNRILRQGNFCEYCGNDIRNMLNEASQVLDSGIANTDGDEPGIEVIKKKPAKKKVKLKIILLCFLICTALVSLSFFAIKHTRAVKAESDLKLAYKMINEGDYEEAIVAFTNAIKIDPNNVEAKIGLAKIYALTGKVDEARESFENLVKKYPNYPDPYIELYYIYLDMGELDKIEPLLEEGIKNTNDIRLQRLLESFLQKKLLVKVTDIENAAPVADAEIKVYAGDDSTEVSVSTQSFEDGTFALKLVPGYYRITIEADNYVPIDVYQEINLEKDTYKFDYKAVKKKNDAGENAKISCRVVNSITRQEIAREGMKVKLVKGIFTELPKKSIDETSGVTDANGKFSLDLPLGNYTAIIDDLEGFQKQLIPVTVYKNAEISLGVTPAYEAKDKRKLVGQVIDAGNLRGIENANVTVYYGLDYSDIAGFTKSDVQGIFNISLLPGTYNIVISCRDYITIKSYQIVNQDDITFQAKLKAVKNDSNLNGTVKGRLINGFTGEGVQNSESKLKFIPGVYGSIPDNLSTQWTANTDANGDYSISLLPGNYTVVASNINGYSSSFAQIVATGDKAIENQDITITPIIPEDQIRIILTWSDNPNDLDSHLLGPSAVSGERFHTMYNQKKYQCENVRYAELDLDDTSGYGPETTTIYKQHAGVYKFVVHDYTNKSNSGSSALSNSGASIVVYWGNGRKYVYNVPPNVVGNVWNVFQIAGSEIKAINSISTQDVIQ